MDVVLCLLKFMSGFKLLVFVHNLRQVYVLFVLIPLLQYNRIFSVFLGGREACLDEGMEDGRPKWGEKGYKL